MAGRKKESKSTVTNTMDPEQETVLIKSRVNLHFITEDSRGIKRPHKMPKGSKSKFTIFAIDYFLTGHSDFFFNGGLEFENKTDFNKFMSFLEDSYNDHIVDRMDITLPEKYIKDKLKEMSMDETKKFYEKCKTRVFAEYLKKMAYEINDAQKKEFFDQKIEEFRTFKKIIK